MLHRASAVEHDPLAMPWIQTLYRAQKFFERNFATGATPTRRAKPVVQSISVKKAQANFVALHGIQCGRRSRCLSRQGKTEELFQACLLPPSLGMKRYLDLKNAVVVVTGASSGIGREASLRFADKGALLVLVARDGRALDEVATECRKRGGEAIVMAADVSDESAVRAVRDAAVDKWGRIDVWVNDAAVYMMGTIEQTPAELVKRLFDINVLGMVHGSQAALSQFRRQDKGVLINIGSVAGKATYAEAGAYCASKHAVHALTETLRQELMGTNIHACIVGFASVDTPLFQHSANYTGRKVKPMNPVYSPERAAESIVRCAEFPQREVLVGSAPRMMSLMQMFFPRRWERTMPKLVAKDHHTEDPAPFDVGNLYAPHGPHDVSGGWKAARKGPWKMFLGLAAALVPIALLSRRVQLPQRMFAR
jgi:short-subunit dehydrogenase